MGRHRRILDDAATAFPSARPPMKLERINAAAQTELPNASPLSRSQRVSNMSAPIPDRKRIAQRIVSGAPTRTPRGCASYDTCNSEAGWDLFIVTKTGGKPQNNGPCDSGQKRAGKDTQLCGVNRHSLIERKHCDKQRHGKTDSGEPRITEQRCPAHSMRKFGNA